jgi:hypothetical protein
LAIVSSLRSGKALTCGSASNSKRMSFHLVISAQWFNIRFVGLLWFMTICANNTTGSQSSTRSHFLSRSLCPIFIYFLFSIFFSTVQYCPCIQG